MKKSKFLALALLTATLAPALSSCSASEGALIIRVLNSEDYIYLHDPKNGYDEPNLTDQFADYIESTPALKAKYGKVKVVYNTADTMENIYSEMQTGKTSYDLICASDYIIAKMARFDLIKKIDKTLIPNYFGDDETVAKSSKALTSRLESIKIHSNSGDSNLGEYAVGYMWGTLGVLFNPEYYNAEAEGYDLDSIISDMADVNNLWNSKYKNTISIKDSMRDTFAFGLMRAYENDTTDINEAVQKGFKTLHDQFYVTGEITLEEYNEEFSKLFNYVTAENSDPQTVVDNVKNELYPLKANAFGLEVDSGKQDIVTGKIGINTAWSGDAVYSIEQAEDPEQVSHTHELYYSIPQTGSNLWMDCWVAPKINNQSELQWELAHEFLNYLSDPTIASKNMDYTGYTSFIAGDAIVDLARDWYDSRTGEAYYIDEEENYFDIYAVDPSIDIDDITAEVLNDETKVAYVSYNDLAYLDGQGHNDSLDDYLLYYGEFEYNENDEIEDIISLEPHPLFDEDGNEVTEIVDDEEVVVQKKYGDLTLYDIASDEDGNLLYETVDLSYFFADTLEDLNPATDMLFFSDEYSYLTIEETEDGEPYAVPEICVGRYFYTQYPDENTLARCAVMEDYVKGDQDLNPLIMKMWEDFKSDPLPIWAIILFVLLVVLLAGSALYLFMSKRINKKLRQKRKALQA